MSTPGATAVVILILSLLSRPATACSCVYSPEQDHPCVSYSNADAVFSGRAAAVSVVHGDEEDAWGGSHRVFRFEILEGFSGVDGTTVDVATGMGGGDCGYSFEVGKSYFVSAWRTNDGTLATGICSRTSLLDKATAALDHARRVRRGEPATTLFGKIDHVERARVKENPTRKGLGGLRITVEGRGGERFSAVTDENGWFEIRERLSGPYTVRAAVTEGLPPAASQEVVVPAGRCTGVWLRASVLGRVQGRVLEATGKPPRSLRLSLVPLRGKPEVAAAGEAYTVEEGAFEFHDVPPGDYLLAVNPAGPSSFGPPYPPTFYPSASTPEAALAITVRPSETVELRDLQLPPPLVERSISGQVRRYDRQPAAGVVVRVIGPDGRESTTWTDEAGRFKLQVYEGSRYRIAAERAFRGWATCSVRVEVEIGSENEPLDLILDRFSTAPEPCLPDL